MKESSTTAIRPTDSPYVRDILEQAHLLAPAIERMVKVCAQGSLPGLLEGNAFDRIVLTGMGSSYWVLYPLYLRLIARQRPTWLVETSELLYHAPALLSAGRTLVIVASQSGASGEVVRLLHEYGDRLSVLGLTNEPEGPLAREAKAALVFGVGPEATVSCKTFTACLAAQSLLGDVLLRLPLDTASVLAAASAISAYLERWQTFVKALGTELKDIRQLYLAGRGASLAVACTGGLVIKESTHVAAEGMSCAAFRHGPVEMVGPETFVVVFAGSEPTQALNRGLYEDIVRLGGRAALVNQSTEHGVWDISRVGENALPMLEILPVQMMTLALAEMKGHTPGTFTFASKITAQE